jgi:hypothetical protein
MGEKARHHKVIFFAQSLRIPLMPECACGYLSTVSSTVANLRIRIKEFDNENTSQQNLEIELSRGRRRYFRTHACRLQRVEQRRDR